VRKDARVSERAGVEERSLDGDELRPTSPLWHHLLSFRKKKVSKENLNYKRSCCLREIEGRVGVVLFGR
jgi:hypothetical protein